MVFPGELGKQTELAADVPVGFGVKLILAVLAANDPGLGFGTGEQAELVVLMEQADVGARGSIVASAQVVVDFQVGGSDGKRLGLMPKAPAAACPAFEIGWSRRRLKQVWFDCRSVVGFASAALAELRRNTDFG